METENLRWWRLGGCLVVVAGAVAWGAALYVVAHFVGKYW